MNQRKPERLQPQEHPKMTLQINLTKSTKVKINICSLKKGIFIIVWNLNLKISEIPTRRFPAWSPGIVMRMATPWIHLTRQVQMPTI